MEIQFPVSTQPSVNPGENGGRLINAYAEVAPEGSRSKYIWRRSPGLDYAFAAAGSGAFRGALLVDTILYLARGDKVDSVTKSGSTYTVQALSGTLGGTGPVTMAHNMRAAKQILIQTSDGPFQIVGTTVSSFSDADLPSSLMITYQDGYFFWPAASGRVTASDLNDDEVNSNSFVTAESQPDGMIRCVPFRRDMLFMGAYSTEVWSNAGTSPFPYSRVTVLPIGLYGINAVTGYEPGFPGPLAFVGNDCVVYKMVGYGLERVSTPQLERLLVAVTDRSTVKMNSFIAAGHHFVSISSADWTWFLDLSAPGNFWHERVSYGQDNWRVGFTINAFDEWLALDATTTSVYRINDRNFRENTEPLVWEVQSIQQHGFPQRTAITRASFDFITGVGLDRGIDPIESNPRVSISWSNDGGRTWGTELLRDLGTQGEYQRIDVWRTGLTKREGRQWKLRISDPIEAAMMGGSMFGESRP